MTEQNSEQNEWAKREIGALWVKESPNQKYFSGHFTTTDEMGVEQKVRVVIFSNKHKKKDTHPDFRIYKSVEPAANQTQPAAVGGTQGIAQPVVEEELI